MKSEFSDYQTQTAALLESLCRMLTNCADVIEGIEHSLADWIVDIDPHNSVPTEQLQRLDYLRQVQSDLASMVGQMKIGHQDKYLHSRGYDTVSLYNSVKLGETKQNLSIALGAEPKTLNGLAADSSCSGDVDFFS